MNLLTQDTRLTADDTTRLIPLTQGQFALVDIADYERLSEYRWWAQYDPDTTGYYARTQVKRASKDWPMIAMHRLIMGLKSGDKRKVDHANMNSLDNRRSNLRIANNFQNGTNSRIPAHNTSGFKGVSWRKDRKHWIAQIRINGINIKLGSRKTPEEAHALYCSASEKYHKEFGRTQ